MKFFRLLMTFCLLAGMAGCGTPATPQPNGVPSVPPAAPQSTSPSDPIGISITDTGDRINNFETFMVVLENYSGRYVSAEVALTAFDEKGDQVSTETFFCEMEPPDDLGIGTLLGSFLVPVSESYRFEKEIVSCETFDSYQKSPEITDENVRDFIRVHWFNYGRRAGDVSEDEITVDIRNRSSHYFTGQVEITALDAGGSVLANKTVDISNGLLPYGGENPVLLWLPHGALASIDYTIISYNFFD